MFDWRLFTVSSNVQVQTFLWSWIQSGPQLQSQPQRAQGKSENQLFACTVPFTKSHRYVPARFKVNHFFLCWKEQYLLCNKRWILRDFVFVHFPEELKLQGEAERRTFTLAAEQASHHLHWAWSPGGVLITCWNHLSSFWIKRFVSGSPSQCLTSWDNLWKSACIRSVRPAQGYYPKFMSTGEGWNDSPRSQELPPPSLDVRFKTLRLGAVNQELRLWTLTVNLRSLASSSAGTEDVNFRFHRCNLCWTNKSKTLASSWTDKLKFWLQARPVARELLSSGWTSEWKAKEKIQDFTSSQVHKTDRNSLVRSHSGVSSDKQLVSCQSVNNLFTNRQDDLKCHRSEFLHHLTTRYNSITRLSSCCLLKLFTLLYNLKCGRRILTFYTRKVTLTFK